MKLTLLLFTILMTSLISNHLLASPYLPVQYPLEKISITISSQADKENPESYQILINGNGGSFFRKNNEEKQALSITSDTLIELLNDFYAIHFFEIADTFTVKKQVILKDNKMVTTVIKKESNVDGKKICIKLRSYKKCLRIIDNQPSAVAQIVNKIEILARSKP